MDEGGGVIKKQKARARKREMPVHPFDAEHGVETSGLISGSKLETGHAHDAHTTAYYGVQPSIFIELMRRWQQGPRPFPLKRYTFVDFGAGKGRAMLLASQMGFKEVVGVELHHELAEAAERNVSAWQASGQAQSAMRVVRGDATEFVFPKGPCVAYMFNPFGRPVLRKLVRRMEESYTARPLELDLLYVNDEFEAMLKRHPGFVRMWKANIHMSEEDAAAEVATMRAQEKVEYASSGYETCCAYRWVGRG